MSVLALGLLLPACSESGMRADQDEAEIPAGTQLHVRLDQNMKMDNDGWSSGDDFTGTLDRALQVNGQVIAPEGTIVKGEFTNDIDTAGTDRDADKATGDNRVEPGRDDANRPGGSVAGDYGTNRDRLGLELKKIVISGEEYDIDTHAVPVPGMMASGQHGASGSMADRGAGTGTTGADRPGAGKGTTTDRGTTRDKPGSDMSGHAMSQIAGQQFIFTLEEPAELPSTANMKTE